MFERNRTQSHGAIQCWGETGRSERRDPSVRTQPDAACGTIQAATAATWVSPAHKRWVSIENWASPAGTAPPRCGP